MKSTFKDKIAAHLVEIIIVASLLLVSLGFVLGFSLSRPSSSSIATIRHRSEVVMSLDLNKESEERQFQVEGDHGEFIVCVRLGEIRMLQSDCPSQFCVHEGWVKPGSKPIICAYNGISITFEEDSGGTAILG